MHNNLFSESQSFFGSGKGNEDKLTLRDIIETENLGEGIRL